YQTRRYLYAIFMCQLAIEKGLKAVVVARTGRLAPKTHNLTYLAELGQVQLTEEAEGVYSDPGRRRDDNSLS
ncbi:MAG: HEPN domain-containing protein, partial [Bacillota bacterium]